MGEAKIERIDQRLSEVLQPHDLPQRDLLNEMEPVHAAESGAFEEVRYDIPVAESDLFADSLQRSARKFGTQTPTTKKKEEKVTITITSSRVTGLDNIRKNLQEVIARLVKQKKITLPEYCRFEVSEYIIKNRHKFPFLKQSAIEVIKDDIEKKWSSPHDYMLKKPGAPDTYRCIISIPQVLASYKRNPYMWFGAVLRHEITHCRDSHPSSGMTKLTNALGISRAEDAAEYTVVHEYVAYIEQLDSLIKEKTGSIHSGMKAVSERKLVLFASKLTMNLSMMDKHKQRLARTYFAKRIRGISQEVKDRLRKRLAEEYYFNDSVLILIGL